MKQSLNEVKRMQQLAGILKESVDEVPEEVKNKPGYDELIKYLETHKSEVEKLAQAADEMRSDNLQEALDKNKIMGYLSDVGIASGLGALLGSILAGVADPANVLDAIAAGVTFAGGATSLVSLPSTFKKDTK